MATSAKQWLRLHVAGEKALSRAIGRFFADQSKRLMRALDDFDSPTPANVAEVFRVSDEHEAFMRSVADVLIGLMVSGAQSVLTTATKKDVDLDSFDLPDDVKNAIRTSFAELAEQSYWTEIQKATSDNLQQLLTDSMNEGLTKREIRKKVQAALADASKVRSAAIARTETTMAYNAGHQAVYEDLAADGSAVGKKWLAILGPSTRETHVLVHGSIVRVSENFRVGRAAAPYPGHWSLPAVERVNCRCTTVAVLAATLIG